MIANYHTIHGGAAMPDGTEREYVERAIEGGLKILGFSRSHRLIRSPDRLRFRPCGCGSIRWKAM